MVNARNPRIWCFFDSPFQTSQIVRRWVAVESPNLRSTWKKVRQKENSTKEPCTCFPTFNSYNPSGVSQCNQCNYCWRNVFFPDSLKTKPLKTEALLRKGVVNSLIMDAVRRVGSLILRIAPRCWKDFVDRKKEHEGTSREKKRSVSKEFQMTNIVISMLLSYATSIPP